MLSEALKEIRAFHQISQTDLAGQLDISKSYLSELEKGTKNPTVELLNRYSLVFDIPVSSLMLFAENLDSAKASDQFRLKYSRKIQNVMEWIRSRYELENR